MRVDPELATPSEAAPGRVSLCPKAQTNTDLVRVSLKLGLSKVIDNISLSIGMDRKSRRALNNTTGSQNEAPPNGRYHLLLQPASRQEHATTPRSACMPQYPKTTRPQKILKAVNSHEGARGTTTIHNQETSQPSAFRARCTSQGQSNTSPGPGNKSPSQLTEVGDATAMASHAIRASTNRSPETSDSSTDPNRTELYAGHLARLQTMFEDRPSYQVDPEAHIGFALASSRGAAGICTDHNPR